MQTNPIDEAFRAQRSLTAVSDLLIGTNDMTYINRECLSDLLGLIDEHLARSLDKIEKSQIKNRLHAV